MLSLLITAYIIGALITASLLIAWFYSSLPLHVLYMLKRLHLLQLQEEALWDMCPEFVAGDINWQELLIMGLKPSWFNNMIVDLLSCKICLSFHIGFWTSTVISLILFYGFIACPVVFFLIPAATFSYPILSNLILKYGIPTD